MQLFNEHLLFVGRGCRIRPTGVDVLLGVEFVRVGRLLFMAGGSSCSIAGERSCMKKCTGSAMYRRGKELFSR